MSKAAIAIVVVLSVLAGCLIGIPIGYIGPKVYEGNFVPTPTATPTPSTMFVPSDITLEELRMKETVTVHDYVSLQLSTGAAQSVTREKINLAVVDKPLQAFEATVISIKPSDAGECVIGVFSDGYPNLRSLAIVSADWCTSLGINSKVIVSGTINDISSVGKDYFQVVLDDAGLSVR